MTDSSEVVVIGGGAAGCAAALYLAESGIRTTVVERQGVASYASGYSAGGLNPLQGAGIPGPLAPLAWESFRMHLELWERLEEASGVDFHARRIGSVDVAFDEDEFARFEETRPLFEAADGFSAQWVDAPELLRAEPRLAGDALGGLRLFGNAALDSSLFTQALRRAAESLGATLRHAGVTALQARGGSVEGVVLDDGRIACDTVVVATGPWSADAERWLGVPIPVVPLKGEILRLRPPGGPLAHDWAGAGVSLNDRAGGLAWVGATEQRKGWDVTPSEWARQKLSAGAARLMPSFAGAELVLHTACLRPVTPDWLPILGRVPGWDNAYLATGAGKKGILLAPAMGRAVADLVAGRARSLDLSPFAPERFA